MKQKLSMFIFALFLMISFGNFEKILACSCVANISVCQRYGFSEAIFVGRAVKTITNRVQSEGNEKYTYKMESTVFEVAESISGVKKEFITVKNKAGTSCDIDFKKGKTYLIFANGNEKDGYGTGYCSGNLEITEANETLNELRTLSSNTSSGKIYGEVYESLKKRTEEQVPMSGVNIKVEEVGGKRNIFDTVTDAEGKYQLPVPLGKYRITPLIPSYAILGLYSEELVSISNNGCFEKDFSVENNATFKGKVLDSNGNPVKDLRIEFVSVDEEETELLGGKSNYSRDYSDEKGNFEITRIPSGNYTLSINFTSSPDEKSPFPVSFHPNVKTRGDAQVFEIGFGQSIENIVFQLPPRLTLKKIIGTVVFPDGSPAGDFTVNLQRGDSEKTFSYTRTDKNGNFELNGFLGEEYNFGIDYYGNNSKNRNWSVKKSVFKLDEKISPFRLVLEKKKNETFQNRKS